MKCDRSGLGLANRVDSASHGRYVSICSDRLLHGPIGQRGLAIAPEADDNRDTWRALAQALDEVAQVRWRADQLEIGNNNDVDPVEIELKKATASARSCGIWDRLGVDPPLGKQLNKDRRQHGVERPAARNAGNTMVAA